MMSNCIVTLTDQQTRAAILVGNEIEDAWRAVSVRDNDDYDRLRREGLLPDDSRTSHIKGAVAEAAAAEWFGVSWHARVWTVEEHRAGAALQHPDCGGDGERALEVKRVVDPKPWGLVRVNHTQAATNPEWDLVAAYVHDDLRHVSILGWVPQGFAWESGLPDPTAPGRRGYPLRQLNHHYPTNPHPQLRIPRQHTPTPVGSAV